MRILLYFILAFLPTMLAAQVPFPDEMEFCVEAYKDSLGSVYRFPEHEP